MNYLRKSLALFLAVIMMFSSMSVAGFAAEDICYTVETYFMDTSGRYPSVPTVETFSANAGEKIELSASEVEGFTFDSVKSECVFTVKSDSSSVGRIYYSRNKYTATYVYEDLLGAQTEESLVYYGAEIPSFEANPSGKPAKQGYNFIMWSLEEDTPVELPSRMLARDIEMYPIYELKEYIYTFDAGENGCFPDGERIKKFAYFYGDVPEFPQDNPVMPHMEFVDWDNTIPSVVTKNMTFTALYNEISYAAVFMDGEEEIAYLDGYYYGDIIEDVDVPEGYEAWTLSDGTYVEFPYTVEGNTVFYAAKSPSYFTARFYLDAQDSDTYEEFSVLQGEEIDFPADPEKEGYTFIGWNYDITVMPSEDVDFIAEWEVNKYIIIFDTKGADEIEPSEVAYGELINVPANITKDGYVFAGWDGIPEDGIMPSHDIILTAKWEKSVSEDSLSFRTQLYTFDEASGDWVVAEKVERGEKVKARIFIETGFAVGTGQVLCFFDDDVFTIDSVMGATLAVNGDPASSAKKFGASGTYGTPPKSHSNFTDLVDFGYITQDFLDKHSPVTFSFRFSSFKCHAISGDEWFAEFDLTVKEDAVGTGDFFVVPETIVNSEDGYYAYITLSKGEEGGSSLSAESMLSWNPSTSVESKSVSTGYGRIILNADGGVFASVDSDILISDFAVGERIVCETPYKEGFVFAGWDTVIPAVMTEEIISSTALWEPCADTLYTVKVNYYDFSAGEGILSEKTYEFSGTTGNQVLIVDEIPDTPEENTEYILLSGLTPDYNVFSSESENIMSRCILPDGSTALIVNFIPVTHVVIFDANGGYFNDGERIKYIEVPHGELASENIPYSDLYKDGYVFNKWFGLGESTRIVSDITFMADWEAVEFDIRFDAASGIFDNGESYYIIKSKVGESVIAPVPELEGYEFLGWHDELGNEYGFEFVVPECEDLVLIAGWKEIPVETTTETTTEPTTVTTTEPTTTENTTESTTESTTAETTTEATTATTEPSTTEPVTEPSTTKPVITEPSTTEPVTEPSTTKPVTESTTKPVTETTTTKPVVTQSTTVTTTKPVVTEPTTVPTTVHKHSPKTVVKNATCDNPGEKYEVCNDCGQKIGSTTVIPALGHKAGEWQTVKEPTYESQGMKIKKCTRSGCGKILEQAVIPVLERENVELSIRKPSITTIKYGDSIYLHAETELPAGAKVVWSANNSNFSYTVSSDGMTCLISPTSKGDTEFTAKVVDSKGNVISEVCTQKMTSKAGFFQKIAAFFKRLFGLTKVYPESVVFIYDK